MALTDNARFRYYFGGQAPDRPSSGGWQRYHRQRDVVRTVIERLNLDGRFDWLDIPGAAEAFADEAELFQALHAFWHARFAGRLDSALETGDDLRRDVLQAYRKTMAELPGLRRFLDAHSDHPAIRRAVRDELRQIAVAAGVVSSDAPIAHAVAEGARLVERAERERIDEPRKLRGLRGFFARMNNPVFES